MMLLSCRLRQWILIVCMISICRLLPADERPSTLPQIGQEAAELLTRFHDYDPSIPLEARTVRIKGKLVCGRQPHQR